MDRFIDHYFEDNTFMMPIDLDLCSINERGEMEIGIPLKYLPQLVEHDVIRLSRDGKTFKSLKEAYEHYDSLNEQEKKSKKENRTRTKVTDPETGEVRDFEVAAGNAKIGGDTVLLNMSTAGNCMSAILGTCKLGPNGQCYALRFEKQWKGSMEKNIRHEEQWACLTPRGIAQGLVNITEVMPRIKYIRINEAGEFRNLPSDPELLARVPEEKKAQMAGVDDVEKLRQVGKELISMGSDLKLYTYTHRTDLNIGDLGPNICVNGSGFMLDNAFVPLELNEFNEVMDLVERNELHEFNGVTVNKGVHCLGDCRKCRYCKEKTKKHIFLPIHGSGTEYQVQLNKILTTVIEMPEFAEIMAGEGNPKEKGQMAMNLVPDNLKKQYQRLVPIRQDRIDLFADIFKSKGQSENLINAIEKYVEVGRIQNGDANIEITQQDSTEGLVKSVDALTGKFEAELERARAQGQAPAAKKWSSLLNALNKSIEMAKKGETPKVSKAVAKQHAGVFRRLKKEI